MPRFLQAIQVLLFTIAVSLLGYVAYGEWDAYHFQRTAQIQFEVRSPNPLPPPTPGLIGQLEIARLGLQAIVVEGTTYSNLRRAVGHIQGTGLPGQPGNIALSAHRDTFFRPLRNIRRNDLITLTTLTGEFRYRVVSTQIVPPSDLTVLEPGKGEILTLITCHPFYYIGTAPNRFIVRAQRIL